MSNTKNRFISARTCFENIKSSPYRALAHSDQSYIDNQISLINDAISINVDPLLNKMSTKQSGAASQLDQINNTNINLITLKDIQTQTQNMIAIVSNSNSLMDGANQDLQNTQSQTDALNTEATRYQSACTAFQNPSNGQLPYNTNP